MCRAIIIHRLLNIVFGTANVTTITVPVGRRCRTACTRYLRYRYSTTGTDTTGSYRSVVQSYRYLLQLMYLRYMYLYSRIPVLYTAVADASREYGTV